MSRTLAITVPSRRSKAALIAALIGVSVPVSGGAVVTSPLITLTGAFNSPSGSGFAFPGISTSRYLASFGANLIITPAGSN